MTFKQLVRLLVGEKVGIKNGRIFIKGGLFIVEEKIEVSGNIMFATVGGFEDLEAALKRLS